MVSRLHPLELSLDFEDRTYRLGETIELSLGLEANRDVEIREARVDLLSEWAESETGTVRPATGATRGAPGSSQAAVPKQHHETYIHSGVVFLQDSELRSAWPKTCAATLTIQPEPPPHAGKIKWSLLVTIDVSRARDITLPRAVDVVLS